MLPKTTFQDEISFRYELLGGELTSRIVRELLKTRKLLPNVTNDQQSKAWVWQGSGTETDPWYWVKVGATNIVTFSGFYTGAVNWSKFRRDVRGALLEALAGVETDFLLSMTASYSWIVPRDEMQKKFTDLMKFSRLFVPDDLDEIERFSSLLFSPATKQRILFEATSDVGEGERKLALYVQTNAVEKISLANVLDDHFTSSDSAYEKANSAIESLFRN